MCVCSSHELKPQSKVTEESAAAPPAYEAVPIFGEASYDNLAVEPNIAYGTHVQAMEPNTVYETIGFQEQDSENLENLYAQLIIKLIIMFVRFKFC